MPTWAIIGGVVAVALVFLFGIWCMCEAGRRSDDQSENYYKEMTKDGIETRSSN